MPAGRLTARRRRSRTSTSTSSAANPKPFVGYSDITALHIAIRQATGLATLYGYGLVGVGDKDGDGLLAATGSSTCCTGDGTGEVPQRPRRPVRPRAARREGDGTARRRLPLAPHADDGHAVGVRVPTTRSCSSRTWKAPPYYVDGFLTQLAAAGKLQRVAGVVVGEMKDCDWGDQREASDWARSRSLEDVLEERLVCSAFQCCTSFRSATGSTSLHFRSAFVVRSTAVAEPSRWTNRRSDREVIKEGDMKKRSSGDPRPRSSCRRGDAVRVRGARFELEEQQVDSGSGRARASTH